MNKMFATNYAEVAVTPERKDALEIIEAGIEASLPEEVLKNKFKLNGNILAVDGKKINLLKYDNLYVVGGGKAAYLAAKYIEKVLGDRITDGAVIDVKKGRLERIRCYEGSHPYPTKRNVVATREVISILKKAKKNDLVITIVSGGGSSLLCDPYKITYSKIEPVIKSFFKKGANIKEINIVRKHISNIHGGNIAKLAYPASVLGLVFSDIPFKDTSFVASGPTYLDKTTKAQAKRVAEKYGIKKLVFLETTKDRKYFKNVTNVLMLSNDDALKAMKSLAEKKGYKTLVCGNCLGGEARKLMNKLFNKFKMLADKSAFIAGGETIVYIKKKGEGGRNLEVAMGALEVISPNMVVMSVASDGKDHMEGIAGGIADKLVSAKAKEIGYNPQEFLDKNMSYKFMKDTGGLIRSKKTGTNVSDLIVVLKRS